MGFGFIKPYRDLENFNHTGMLTYFILPEYTGQGVGTKIMHALLEKGKSLGIHNFVAHISSKNKQSLRFHQKQGFKECGRIKNIGHKFGEFFDLVWVQKQLPVKSV